MIATLARPYWNHLRVRARTCLLSPSAIAVLVLFGLAGTALWPGPSFVSPAAGDQLDLFEGGVAAFGMHLLWLYLWPMLPMVYVRGRATGAAHSNPLSFIGAPALPASPAARALAEATLALAAMGGVRIAALALGRGVEALPLVAPTLAGAVFLLPMALAWGLPAADLNHFMWRPLAVAVLATGLHAGGGWLHSQSGLVAVGLALGILVLATARIELPGWRPRTADEPAARRVRPAARPDVCLRRDAWARVATTWGPWLALAAALFVLALVLEARGVDPGWLFFAGFEVFLVIGLQPAFRPFNLDLVGASLVGKHGASRGDFMRAWAVLPVGREAVLRRVWLHGMVTGLVVWIVPVGLLAVRTRLRLGQWGLRDTSGDSLLEFIVLGAAMIPMFAGLLVAAALGRRLETALSGLPIVLGVYTVLPVKVLLTETFGRASAIADAGPIIYLATMAAVASLPPLRFLWRVPRIEPLT
jgi:hypothetical protein